MGYQLAASNVYIYLTCFGLQSAALNSFYEEQSCTCCTDQNEAQDGCSLNVYKMLRQKKPIKLHKFITITAAYSTVLLVESATDISACFILQFFGSVLLHQCICGCCIRIILWFPLSGCRSVSLSVLILESECYVVFSLHAFVYPTDDAL